MGIEDYYYDRLIRPIEGQMKGSVWRIVRDPDEADDAFQEAVAKIWEHIDRILRHPNPHALILRICANAAYDALRRRTRRYRGAVESIPGEVADPAPAASDRVAQRETRAEVLEAIGRLSRRQAAAILMRCVQEQSYEDIAVAMGCSEGTVRVHINRGRDRLRKTLAHLAPRSRRRGVGS